ncbi:CocE/NonD family hydrolase [Sphingomonas sp. 67-36]|uniref:CocE/NonD family hydrolase n=1 Tax=Sphingomonas sp. 67-36 TaxID=1895849 RepID=UPI00092AE774|nr:CocE/NonD family hydrolase [Sphingomonas sp. 67-36]OJV33189.1 MAG: antibiotic hydrolase [Sphingomonas sp. 67-36]
MASVLNDHMVPMRDGVHLATDIYLPAGPGPFPVLLERTPYDKRGTNHGDLTAADLVPRPKPQIARWFAEAGYAYVLQDCRGRFGSEGVFTKYLSEAEDGADTLAWLLEQSWCDGRIGTLGLSYGAHVQNALACLNPPGLKAMFLDSGGFSSAYHGGARQGGAFELKQLTWARKHALQSPETAADPARRAALEQESIEQWIGRRWRLGHSPLAAAPEYEAYVVEQWDNDRLTDFWKQRGIYALDSYADYADVPAVHMASWYDPYSQTAIDNFTALAPIKHGPIKLVLGPWTHGQRSVTYAGDADFGAEAVLDGHVGPDYFTLRRDWFDRHMLGREDAPEHLPAPVRIFVMGGGSGLRTAEGRLDHGGRWRDEQAWPPARARDVAMFLHRDGSLRETPPAAGIEPLSYDFDPADPVPTIGGAIASGAPVMFAGGYDQRETETLFGARHPGRALADRADVLVFETEPLARDVEVTGNVVAHLHIASSAVDTDFTIKLVDVYPPNSDYPQGYALNLAHGILRARFRNSFEHPQPLEPGKVHALTVRAFPTSNLFRAGHRIRIEVSSSNFPHFDVNPNSDWRVADAPPVVARNSVFVDRDHPSCVALPIVADTEG